VSIQEAIRTAEYDMVSDLLGPEYRVVYQQHPEADGQSAAIASRWPITNVSELEQRVTDRVDLEMPHRPDPPPPHLSAAV
jgi:hypothetical protein